MVLIIIPRRGFPLGLLPQWRSSIFDDPRAFIFCARAVMEGMMMG
jgi:hypothetical protein